MKQVRQIFKDLLDQQQGLPKPRDPYSCWCYNCLKGVVDNNGWPVVMSRMVLCPQCGNKRCPQATDHRYSCTNSNKPGQPGSRY